MNTVVERLRMIEAVKIHIVVPWVKKRRRLVGGYRQFSEMKVAELMSTVQSFLP